MIRQYVTFTLVAEMRANFGHELRQINKRLERIEERCAERMICVLQQRQERVVPPWSPLSRSWRLKRFVGRARGKHLYR